MSKYLIVGLGNPGQKYADTRHNIGFWVVDELVRRYDFRGHSEHRAIVFDGIIKGKKVILAKPMTYMNNSGESVQSLVSFYKIDLDKIIVIYDEIDLPLGTLRIRKTGGHGGHNGLRNIIQHLKEKDFARIRIGVDRPPGKMQAKRHVLRGFHGDDKIVALQAQDKAADAVEMWLETDIEQVMTAFNGDFVEAEQDDTPKLSPKELLKQAKQAHQANPNDPEPLEQIVGLSKRLGKLKDEVDVHLKLADIYEKLGEPDKANTNRERAVSIEPSLIDVHMQIADYYDSIHNKKKAVNRYLILAEWYLEQGKPMEALDIVQVAMAINPQHPQAIEMQFDLQRRITE